MIIIVYNYSEYKVYNTNISRADITFLIYL